MSFPLIISFVETFLYCSKAVRCSVYGFIFVYRKNVSRYHSHIRCILKCSFMISFHVGNDVISDFLLSIPFAGEGMAGVKLFTSPNIVGRNRQSYWIC